MAAINYYLSFGKNDFENPEFEKSEIAAKSCIIIMSIIQNFRKI